MSVSSLLWRTPPWLADPPLPDDNVMDGWGARPLRWLSVIVFCLPTKVTFLTLKIVYFPIHIFPFRAIAKAVLLCGCFNGVLNWTTHLEFLFLFKQQMSFQPLISLSSAGTTCTTLTNQTPTFFIQDWFAHGTSLVWVRGWEEKTVWAPNWPQVWNSQVKDIPKEPKYP